MRVHLYGVLDAGTSISPSIPGLDGRAVRALAVGGRWAWVSDIDEPTLTVTPRRLREHDAVLGAMVAAGGSPVPALMGRLYIDDAAVIAVVHERAAELDVAVSLLRGRVEMSLLITGAPAARRPTRAAPTAGEGAGIAHLRRLQGEMHGERNMLHAAHDLAQSLTRALTGMVVAEHAVGNAAPPVLVARAHLVARDDLARYMATVDAMAANGGSGLRVVVRGPGAAYSFAAVRGG